MITAGTDDPALEIPASRRPGRAPSGPSTKEVPVHLLWNIIVLIVVGLIAGFIARAVIPGKQAMSIGMTIVLGIVGSLVGNLLGSLIFQPHKFEIGTSGIIGSIIGAIIVLGVYVMATGRRNRTAVR
jgi:uncharacterized membrane protein YeaQ/YmgE (transglycosylase-associated protein family)